MSDEPLFQTVEAGKLNAPGRMGQGIDLVRMLCRTAREKGRIEITNCGADGGGGSCVMISKEELDYLESALEILSKTDGAKDMQRMVRRYAVLTLEQAPAAASVS